MNGKFHTAVTLGLAGLLLAGSKRYGLPDNLVAATTAGCLIGTVVTPDLDQAESSQNPLLLPQNGSKWKGKTDDLHLQM